MRITDQQRDEFYQGFVTAMLWSSGGDDDYSEAPEGYEVHRAASQAEISCGDSPAYYWSIDIDGDGEAETGEGVHDTEREAIMSAWAHSGEEPTTLDDLLAYDLSPETRQALRNHCNAWLNKYAALILLYVDQRDLTSVSDGSTAFECAGHDLWLTSAGHGVGFWDRGLGLLGDWLAEACEPFTGKHEAYIGDDGLVYVTGMGC